MEQQGIRTRYAGNALRARSPRGAVRALRGRRGGHSYGRGSAPRRESPRREGARVMQRRAGNARGAAPGTRTRAASRATEQQGENRQEKNGKISQEQGRTDTASLGGEDWR